MRGTPAERDYKYLNKPAAVLVYMGSLYWICQRRMHLIESLFSVFFTRLHIF